MQPSTHAHTRLAAVGLVAATIASTAVAPPDAAIPTHAPPAISTADIRLAATGVPPGGLITSFLGNQVTYCAIICPLLVQTGVTAAATTAQAPLVFLAAAQSGNLLKAIGAAAASVTGPTNAAWAATILADGTVVAPRALNAFETGVVGLLNVIPAAANGLPGIVTAIQTARQETFDALHAPIVPNPTPTVMPHGVLQVAVIGLINVGAAIIFPALNDVLGTITSVPDAIAQELAASGDPVRAIAAGVQTAAAAGQAAISVVVQAIDTAINDIRAEAAGPAGTSVSTPDQTQTAATVLGLRTAVRDRSSVVDTSPLVHGRPTLMGPTTKRGVTEDAGQSVRAGALEVKPGRTRSAEDADPSANRRASGTEAPSHAAEALSHLRHDAMAKARKGAHDDAKKADAHPHRTSRSRD
ncbi:MAG: hypothetical protein QOI01_556 [Mycobacterium sp.]|nr:hypothetical protein [Mycobacterium sp.]